MSENVIVVADRTREGANRLVRGAIKGANLPDSMLTEYPGHNSPVLFDQPHPRTGVLQEEFKQNSHGTGRAKTKLHIVDFANSNETDGLRLKLGGEQVEAYCPLLANQETLAKDTTVVLLYINDRWTIISAACT